MKYCEDHFGCEQLRYCEIIHIPKNLTEKIQGDDEETNDVSAIVHLLE